MKKGIVYIKGKESFILSFFTIIISIIVAIPILLILFLKFIYTNVSKIRNQVNILTQINSPSLEKIY